MTLVERFVKYLLKQDTWVSKYKLRDIAVQHGYSYDAIYDAFPLLEKETNVGTWYIAPNDTKAELPYGSYYRAYKLKKSEKEKLEQAKRWFDNL